MTFRPLPVLTVASLLALALLVALGNWQWARFGAKLSARDAPALCATIPGAVPLTEGTVYVAGVLQGQGGWRVFIPVRDASGAVTFVDAGFIAAIEPPLEPPALIAPGAYVGGQPVTPSGRNPFASAPDLERRLFYAVDLATMAAAAGVGPVAEAFIAAPYVGPQGEPIPNPFAPGADPLPPERHLGYALTWWGLAASLVAMYVVYHAQVGRLRFRR